MVRRKLCLKTNKKDRRKKYDSKGFKMTPERIVSWSGESCTQDTKERKEGKKKSQKKERSKWTVYRLERISINRTEKKKKESR